MKQIDLKFNYSPITYGEIKIGVGIPLDKESKTYKLLESAIPTDESLSDIIVRQGGNKSRYGDAIFWGESVLHTIRASGALLRGDEKSYVSIEDVIHAQTFPEDYNFDNRTLGKVQYVCGMSVPPIMIKRIVQRIISSGVFNNDETT